MSNFLGDSEAKTPQRIEETIIKDMGPMLLNQPLPIVIQHLNTFITNSRHEKLQIVSHFGFGNRNFNLSLQGERSESEQELEARLERRRGYVKRDIERNKSKIEELQKEIESLEARNGPLVEKLESI